MWSALQPESKAPPSGLAPTARCAVTGGGAPQPHAHSRFRLLYSARQNAFTLLESPDGRMQGYADAWVAANRRGRLANQDVFAPGAGGVPEVVVGRDDMLKDFDWRVQVLQRGAGARTLCS